MKRYFFVVFLFWLFLHPIPILTQNDTPDYPEVTIPNTEFRIIHSEIVDQDYEISVALPTGYNRTDKVFPVLYVFPGNPAFDIVTDTFRLADFEAELPRVIVVGIDHPRGSNVAALQAHDHIREADKFLQFVNEELMPLIDTDYRTDPTERTIVGFWTGGYFTLYTMFYRPDLFNRYLAISPNWGEPVAFRAKSMTVFQHEEMFASNHTRLNVRLFLAGAVTAEATGIEKFADVIESRNYTGLTMTTMLIDVPISVTVPSAIASGLVDVYCNTTIGCYVPAPVLSPAADSLYPPGTTVTTPDTYLSLAPEPGSYDLSGSCPKKSEATVNQIVEYTDGVIWIELTCGRSTGWVKKSDLEE